MPEGPFILEGEEILREGESRKFSVIWDDFTTISTAGCETYQNRSSQSASMLSGSSAVSGNVTILPLFTVPAGSGGTTIIVEAAMSANSQAYKTGIVCRIMKPGAER